MPPEARGLGPGPLGLGELLRHDGLHGGHRLAEERRGTGYGAGEIEQADERAE